MREVRSKSNPIRFKPSQQSKNKSHLTFMLVSKNKVGISTTFNLMTPQLKNIIKKNNSVWNNDFKLWELQLQSYKVCFSQIKYHFEQKNEKEQSNQTSSKQFASPNINKIPQFVFKAQEDMPLDLEVKNGTYSIFKVIKYSQLQRSIEARVLPFYYKLYNFQKESLQFAISKHGRLLLGDEMGVGKTIQSLAIASVYRHQWPFLVICPSSLRLNWQQQILTWLDCYLKKTEVQVYSKGGTPLRQNIKALIISYDLAWKMKEMLETFKVVIADQAHYLKNTGNKRSDNLIPFLSCRKRVILLSGTPALAKPRELYNLLSIVRPDIFVHFKEFGNRYCDPSFNPWSRALEYNGCQNTRQLHYLITNRIMIRRLKKDVLTQLPDKQRQKIYVETDKAIIKEIKQLLSGFEGNKNSSLDNLVMDLFHHSDDQKSDARLAITQAYTLTSKAKLNSVKDYVLELLNNDIKIIIFAHHMTMLDGLQVMLKDKKVKYMRIDGSVTKEKRHQNVLMFQDQPSIKIALLSITAAGVGLTLTAASTVVFAELHWTPGMMVQAQDRAHRIGQKSSVNCHYLLGENSLDDILYRNLEKKVHNVSSFIDGKEETLKIQRMSKGQKGKISSQAENKISQKNLLVKFESTKLISDKYIPQQQLSDSSDISLTGTDFNKNKSEAQLSQVPLKKMLDISENTTIHQIQTYKKEDKEINESSLQQVSSPFSGELQHRGSSQICNYILTNAQSLLQGSQQQFQQTQTHSNLS